MQNLLFALSLGIAGAVLAMHAAHAQTPTASCADHEQVIERLASKYGETRQSLGLSHNNSVLEIFASPKSGTWTILQTLPDGTSCLMASGDSFNWIKDRKPDGEQT